MTIKTNLQVQSSCRDLNEISGIVGCVEGSREGTQRLIGSGALYTSDNSSILLYTAYHSLQLPLIGPMK